MILGCINCCLFDIGHVLKGGFEMSNVQYSEPKSVLSALQVIGDITLVATAQQFGGFTLPELDKVLLPYVEKSLAAARAKYRDLGLDEDTVERVASRDVVRDLEQGFQSLELKLNTVPCSRGDFAFTTITFGQWNPELFTEEEREWLMTISRIMLQVRPALRRGRQDLLRVHVPGLPEPFVRERQRLRDLPAVRRHHVAHGLPRLPLALVQ